jgi:hypothetical protein
MAARCFPPPSSPICQHLRPALAVCSTTSHREHQEAHDAALKSSMQHAPGSPASSHTSVCTTAQISPADTVKRPFSRQLCRAQLPISINQRPTAANRPTHLKLERAQQEPEAVRILAGQQLQGAPRVDQAGRQEKGNKKRRADSAGAESSLTATCQSSWSACLRSVLPI